MPETHHQEQEQVCCLRQPDWVFEQLFLHCKEGKTHVDVVPKPERQGHMPTVPEFFDVLRNKRLVKVHWSVNAHKIGNRHCKQGITRKIKEQIHAVAVHIGYYPPG